MVCWVDQFVESYRFFLSFVFILSVCFLYGIRLVHELPVWFWLHSGLTIVFGFILTISDDLASYHRLLWSKLNKTRQARQQWRSPIVTYWWLRFLIGLMCFKVHQRFLLLCVNVNSGSDLTFKFCRSTAYGRNSRSWHPTDQSQL